MQVYQLMTYPPSPLLIFYKHDTRLQKLYTSTFSLSLSVIVIIRHFQHLKNFPNMLILSFLERLAIHSFENTINAQENCQKILQNLPSNKLQHNLMHTPKMHQTMPKVTVMKKNPLIRIQTIYNVTIFQQRNHHLSFHQRDSCMNLWNVCEHIIPSLIIYLS